MNHLRLRNMETEYRYCLPGVERARSILGIASAPGPSPPQEFVVGAITAASLLRPAAELGPRNSVTPGIIAVPRFAASPPMTEAASSAPVDSANSSCTLADGTLKSQRGETVDGSGPSTDGLGSTDLGAFKARHRGLCRCEGSNPRL